MELIEIICLILGLFFVYYGFVEKRGAYDFYKRYIDDTEKLRRNRSLKFIAEMIIFSEKLQPFIELKQISKLDAKNKASMIIGFQKEIQDKVPDYAKDVIDLATTAQKIREPQEKLSEIREGKIKIAQRIQLLGAIIVSATVLYVILPEWASYWVAFLGGLCCMLLSYIISIDYIELNRKERSFRLDLDKWRKELY